MLTANNFYNLINVLMYDKYFTSDNHKTIILDVLFQIHAMIFNEILQFNSFIDYVCDVRISNRMIRMNR